MPNVALVTCYNIPEPDTDETVLVEACRSAGLNVELVPWEDEAVDWTRFDLIVPRSTWNYYEHEAEFRRWIDRASATGRICNGREILTNNLDKRYLAGLAQNSIPIVPTRFLDNACELEEVVLSEGWEAFVVKPAVSAASFMTRRFERHELADAATFADGILKSRGAMVQRYLPRVADGGEISLVHIEGELTHGIIKYPRFEGDVESVSDAVTPTREQAELAKRIVSTIPTPWLYARVDLMLDDGGSWLLSELELIEPSLFLCQSKVALDRLVSAISRFAIAV
ncbi:MAG: hypothetical protein P4L46_08655 [Fimbriimonas sp.]|nr:hypothetical protein [Fimbriimonas sp.]